MFMYVSRYNNRLFLFLCNEKFQISLSASLWPTGCFGFDTFYVKFFYQSVFINYKLV